MQHHDPLTTLPAEAQAHRILDTAQTATMTGYSVSRLRKLYAAGKFPPPIKLSERHYGWKLQTVVEWINAKAAGAPTSEAA